MYLFTEKITDTDHVVIVIGYDEGVLDDEAMSKAIIVEAVPTAERKFGKNSILHINPETKGMWYVYEDRPLTTEEEFTQLRVKNESLEQRLNAACAALDDILFNGIPQ